MRITIAGALILSMVTVPTRGEGIVMQLQWGFGPTPSELYWDGQVRVAGGGLTSMKAVSFEPDRHDRMTPPSFRSYTVNNGTDGMELAVEGDDHTTIGLVSQQGTFRWSVSELRREMELSFPSKDGGRFVVRLIQTLGDTTRLLSDKNTQDDSPAAARLADGRLIVLWRAFLGLPSNSPTPETAGAPESGGDQIRGLLMDREGNAGKIFNVLEQPGDVESVALAPAGKSSCTVVWAEQREGNWDLYGCEATASAERVECSRAIRLTTEQGVDKSPAAAAAANGSTALAWQGWRGASSNIFFRCRKEGRWQAPILLSDDKANDWNPTVAAAANGSVAVAWSRWRSGAYDVCLRVWTDGRWGQVQFVSGSDRFEAHPSIAYDDAGVLWIAYEEGRANWGMDSHTAGLRSLRNIRLRTFRHGQVETPRGTTNLNLPAPFQDRSEMAHLATDGHGVLWLLFRSLGERGVWNVYGASLQDDGWTSPEKIRQSEGGQNSPMASAANSKGGLEAVWSADHRTNQVGQNSYVYASTMPRRVRRSRPIETTAASVPAPDVVPAEKRSTGQVYEVGEQQLKLFFGDLHRHTELSVCRTGVDGSLEDAYRYAIDAAALDFLCVTDHVQHVKILNDYDFWRTGKTADLHRVAGLHLPFYGYERSQRFPYGHRNIISISRNVKRVPRTADNRPWSANTGYEGEERRPPPELWAGLVGQNVITIPHTSGSPVMGTDFGHRPLAIEPVVEIYQGCRYTYEYAKAPDPRASRNGDAYGGKTQPEGFIWNALSKGYRYGFIASSDHVATHNSYTCVWADEFSNSAILQALLKRQCYAATDKIECRMQMGEHLMGSEFDIVIGESPEAGLPPLDIKVRGTADIDRVDVIKDNRIVYSHKPDEPTRRVSFHYQDANATPGEHYYYARVIQADRNMAWVSPIWVKVKR